MRGRIGAICAAATLGGARAATLTVALATPPGPLDPAVAPAVEQTLPVAAAYETLVTRVTDPAGGADRLLPGVASAWRASADGLLWTFTIAPGHRFDDGARVDAAACVFTLRRLLALGRGPSDELAPLLAAADAPGPDTLVLRLKRPSPDLPALLATRATWIVNPAIGADGGWGEARLGRRSAGSGAYTVAEPRDPGDVVLVRNPYGAPPAGNVDRVVFSTVRDATVRALALRRGDADIALGIAPQDLPALAADPSLRVVEGRVLGFQALAMNTETGLLRDARLRQAVALAIDTAGLVSLLKEGRASRYPGPIPPGMAGAAPETCLCAQDIPRARALVAAAGSPGTLTLIYPAISLQTDTLAEFLQAELAGVGLTARLLRLSLPAYLGRLQRGAYDLSLAGAALERNDPLTLAATWLDPARIGGEGDQARYRNPEVTALLARAAALPPEQRGPVLREAASRANADAPYAWLLQAHLWLVMRARVGGTVFDPAAPYELHPERVTLR